MAAAKLDAYLIPRADEHQGEYVPACAERLKWLTGFSGSAGLAIVGKKAAVLFVDGRYTVQARAEVDAATMEVSKLPRGRIAEWLSEHLSRGQTVGYDPKLHTVGEVERLTAALKAKDIKLRPVARNLVDRLWGRERPTPPMSPVSVQPLKLAGRSAQDKITDIQARLKADGHDAVILTLSNSVAWAFNIRGADIPHIPVALAFAIIPQAGKPELFIAPEKIDTTCASASGRICQAPRPKPSPTASRPCARPGSACASIRTRRAPGSARAWWATGALRAGRSLLAAQGVQECSRDQGRARGAQARTARRSSRFLAWLDARGAAGSIDEIEAVAAARRLPARDEAASARSASTPSPAPGPNGAIVHYRVTARDQPQARAGRAAAGRLRRAVSGRHHRHHPHRRHRQADAGDARALHARAEGPYRALPRARFPDGHARHRPRPAGAARRCGQHGLDYDHGTGHGVGSYLSVHEGPQSHLQGAAWRALQPGMIVSNEPGYYKEGAYGIRIENLVLVTSRRPSPAASAPMMGFETLTLAPIDRRADRDGAAAPTRSRGSTPTTRGLQRRSRPTSIPRHAAGSPQRRCRSSRCQPAATATHGSCGCKRRRTSSTVSPKSLS